MQGSGLEKNVAIRTTVQIQVQYLDWTIELNVFLQLGRVFERLFVQAVSHHHRLILLTHSVLEIFTRNN